MRQSISDAEQQVIEDLALLEDWMFQFEYLLEKAGTTEKLPANCRDDAHRIPGCQSRVWLLLERNGDGTIHICVDSDALIVKGLLSVAVELLNGRAPEEITGYHERYISETALRSQITTDRFGGIHAVLDAIQNYAAAYL